MDNLIIKKIYQDVHLLELNITAQSKLAWATQNCYIGESDILQMSKRIKLFCESKDKTCYLQIGEKEGNFTSAFSMEFERIDILGHITIEVDIEIDDNEMRKHRCLFYLASDLGSAERFATRLEELVGVDLNVPIELHKEY